MRLEIEGRPYWLRDGRLVPLSISALVKFIDDPDSSEEYKKLCKDELETAMDDFS